MQIKELFLQMGHLGIWVGQIGIGYWDKWVYRWWDK